MGTSRTRDIARILGKSERNNPANKALTFADDPNGGGSSLEVYATLNDLPTSNLTTGDQAYVSENQRMYISNGSGWYNVALINATPSLTLSPSGAIALSPEEVAQTITITAVDSDNADASLTLSVDSGGDFFKMATISQDSSVFTITPRSSDSATATGDDGVATLTFKASDGISFGSEQVTFTLGFTVVNSNFTSLLMKADTAGTDNQVDASTNNHAITETGTVISTGFTPYHPGGYSTYFASSSEHLITNLATSGTDAWTIEWWVYHTANSGTSSQNRNFGAATNDPMFLNTNLNTQNLYIGGQPRVTGSKTMAIGQWYHMALVRSVTSNTIKLYIDGVLEGTSAVQAGTPHNIPAKTDFGIGSDENFNAYGMTGYIRDFRYVIGTEVYTSAFTPPEAPLTAITGTDLLLCNHAAVIDTSGNLNPVTISGTSTARLSPYAQEDEYTKANHGGSLRFGGSSNLNTAAITWDRTKDWTFEGWWYGTNASDGTFATLNVGSGVNGLYVMHGGGVYINGIQWGIPGTPANYFKPNHWNHWALVRHSGTYKFYVNGISMWSETNAGDGGSGTHRFGIGATATNAAAVSDGVFIADVRFTEDGVYTGDFIPPTTPLTVLGDTIFKTGTNTQSIWDAQGGHALIRAGDVAASNTYRNFTTSSAVYFDGTGDYLEVPASNNLAHGADSFTIEFWMYATSVAGTQNIYDTRTGNGFSVNMVSGVVGFYSEPNSGYLLQSSALSADTWYHVAIVRNGTAMAMYIDGTSVATATNSSSFTNTTGTIGARYSRNQQYYSGYLQDFRVSKGLARYTSSFTPAATEHKG